LLNTPAGFPLLEQIRADPLGLTMILLKKLKQLKGEFAIQVKDGFFLSADSRSCLIWAESTLPLTDSLSAAMVQSRLDQVLASAARDDLRFRIIGTLPHTLANATMVQADLKRLLPLATLVLLFFLLLSLRGARALLVLVIPFLAAPAAIAVVGFLYAKISSIALGFGIVLLGISVDFSIHLYYALQNSQGSEATAKKDIWRPIVLSATTTVGVFVVLLFSAVPSHRQMATLSIIGLLLSLILSWHLVPTLIRSGLRSALASSPGPKPARQSTTWPGPTFRMAVWLMLLVAGAVSWFGLRYNGDLRTLDVPNQQILADEEVFRQTWHHDDQQKLIIARGKDLATALQKNDQLYEKFQGVGGDLIKSISPIVPSPLTQAANIGRWQEFWDQRQGELAQNMSQLGSQAGFTEDAFGPFFTYLQKINKTMEPEELLAGPLQPIILSFIRQLGSQDVSQDEVLVVTFLPGSISDHFIEQEVLGQMEGLTLISNSRWKLQVENLLRHDLIKLSLLAGLFITLLTALFFRNLAETAAALAPVFSAIAAMSLFGVATTGELNMMHVLMGIMVIGLSVDYGVFAVYGNRQQTMSVTTRAISICAVSSLIGFGVLAFADHYALHALGTTVLAGIGAAWPTSLFISPILCEWRSKGVG